jgi:hypothetical protein
MCYFSHVDEQGEFPKPFVLPQKDPSLYEYPSVWESGAVPVGSPTFSRPLRDLSPHERAKGFVLHNRRF